MDKARMFPIKRSIGKKVKSMQVAPKALARNERLAKARKLIGQVEQKMRHSGITQEKIEKDVGKAFINVKRERRSSSRSN